MYEDGTAIISQHTCNLEREHHKASALARCLENQLMHQKAQASSTNQRCIGNLPNINIFDQPVSWVTEFKYLGFILDAKLNFSHHIRAALQKAAGMSQTLNFSKE
ncbi:hypothetical protein TNCV_4397261 [Trichonephila clavipes]|nr:hypothetical protein TNCV_4397261 [Trichonephila clavipes]